MVVIPDLDRPGMMASPWAMPRMMVSVWVRSSVFFAPCLAFFLWSSPVAMRAIPVSRSSVCPILVLRLSSRKMGSPMMPVSVVVMMSWVRSFRCWASEPRVIMIIFFL